MANRYHKNAMGGKKMMGGLDFQAGVMVTEDRTKMSNLPQEVIIREYPRSPYAVADVPDTMASIDNQMRADGKNQKRGMYSDRY